MLLTAVLLKLLHAKRLLHAKQLLHVQLHVRQHLVRLRLSAVRILAARSLAFSSVCSAKFVATSLAARAHVQQLLHAEQLLRKLQAAATPTRLLPQHQLLMQKPTLSRD